MPDADGEFDIRESVEVILSSVETEPVIPVIYIPGHIQCCRNIRNIMAPIIDYAEALNYKIVPQIEIFQDEVLATERDICIKVSMYLTDRNNDNRCMYLMNLEVYPYFVDSSIYPNAGTSDNLDVRRAIQLQTPLGEERMCSEDATALGNEIVASLYENAFPEPVSSNGSLRRWALNFYQTVQFFRSITAGSIGEDAFELTTFLAESVRYIESVFRGDSGKLAIQQSNYLVTPEDVDEFEILAAIPESTHVISCSFTNGFRAELWDEKERKEAFGF